MVASLVEEFKILNFYFKTLKSHSEHGSDCDSKVENYRTALMLNFLRVVVTYMYK